VSKTAVREAIGRGRRLPRQTRELAASAKDPSRRPIRGYIAKLPELLKRRRDGLAKDEAEGATPGFSA
jgi:hypothetical protein